MKLSPRHEPTTLAGIELSTAVCEIVKKHDLTFPELVSLLAREMTSWTKWQLRDERSEMQPK